ncbi:hypothetical protein CC78DRAFT_500107 [Lojkania enalia]|uniref:protein-ribulosamine 3-kinase n=1 Tax=Lojkania enalia TaxID=147567 RepID=A0A9P4K3T4_9PLEO|nr:hypothetical protein CC78DRAFT_500107 [Didymosphaeria enalia]
MNYEGARGLEFGGGNIEIDPSVAKVLPHGCRVVSTDGHGVSFRANTGRIDVELADGTSRAYFIKIESKNVGKNMLHSEFESMTAIYQLVPDFAPKPIAWGTYETIPDTHFFLSEFRGMLLDMPDADQFAARLSALHQNSRSPNGKFGFHVITHAGNLPQYTGWEDSWETFFAKSLKQALDLEVKAKGHDPEFDTLIPAIFNKVIPRLLRPLESDGRSIKPSLVHGDLWFANSGVESENGKPLVFDACCFYAHNEYEFGQWRPVCNRFGDEYVAAYHTYTPKSSPEEDFDGRVDLYKLRFNTHVSALFYDNPTLREQMLGDMRDLVARYG